MKRPIVITIGLLVVLASVSMAYLAGDPVNYEVHLVPFNEMQFGKSEVMTIYDGTYGRYWAEHEGTDFEIGPVSIVKYDRSRLHKIRKR